MTTLIIARHGNTFEDGEPPRRVGRRTDLPLTEKGCAQARAIGTWLRDQNLIPDVVYSSTLQRTIRTAELAVEATQYRQPVYRLTIFDEIDYGPDEDRPEAEVIARIGQPALDAWERNGVVPPGWIADAQALQKTWQNFATGICAAGDGETILVVTSNGIARFAPCLASESNCPPKLATGTLGVLIFKDDVWTIDRWNFRPGSLVA